MPEAVKLGGELTVNSVTAGDQLDTRIATLIDGSFVVCWVDTTGDGGSNGGPTVKAQIFSPAGEPVGGEFLANAVVLGGQSKPEVAGLASGGFVLAWTDSNGVGGDSSGAAVKAQLYDAAGATIGTEFLVNTTTVGLQSQPAIAALAGGGFVATWIDRSFQAGDLSDRGTMAQMFDASGAKVGAEFLVNTTTFDDQENPDIAALPDGGFVIVWEDDASAGVQLQLYNSTGSRVGGEFLVGLGFQPAVAALANGSVIVTWSDGGDTWGRMFAPSGEALGAEFAVNTTTEGDQGQPAPAALANGGFVVSWTDYSGLGGDDSESSVKAQLFDAEGARVGDEFLVNTQTLLTQAQPKVTGRPDGSFVIAWRDTIEGNNVTDIKAQIFGVDVFNPEIVSGDGEIATVVMNEGHAFVTKRHEGHDDRGDIAVTRNNLGIKDVDPKNLCL